MLNIPLLTKPSPAAAVVMNGLNVEVSVVLAKWSSAVAGGEETGKGILLCLPNSPSLLP